MMRRPFARALIPAACLAIVPLAATAALAVPAAAQEAADPDASGRDAGGARRAAPPPDLRAVLDTGYVVQDRNGDGVVDFIDGRIVLGTRPGEAEVAAAANIAARLGYETSATELGLAGRDAGGPYDTPVILIAGATGANGNGGARSGGGAPAVGGEGAAGLGLAPGEGAISFVRPDGRYRRGGVRVEGYDATGLGAAADYLSGRYPNIWSLEGATWREVADRLERYLRRRDVAIDALTLDAVVVDARRPGVSRLLATVDAADGESFQRAVRALEPADTTAGAAPADAFEGEERRPDSAAAPSDSVAGPGGEPLERTDLQFRDLHRIDVRVIAGDRARTVRMLPREPWRTERDREWSGTPSPDFTLSDLYTIRGLYRDTNRDLVPDVSEAYVSLHGADSPGALVDFALRAGLETAGVRLPFVRVGGQDDYPERAGFPIVYGVGHYQTKRLRREGRLRGPSGAGAAGRGPAADTAPAATAPIGPPGEGFIEFVEGAFADGERNGLVIGAADARGLDAVTDYVARRMPYLWEHGKGEYEMKDVETEVRRFFEAEDSPGQIALALYKLDDWLGRLEAEGSAIDSVGVELAVEERPDGLDGVIAGRVRERFPRAAVDVATYETGFGVGDTIFEREVEFEWEVDAFWEVFRREALPEISGAAPAGRGARFDAVPASGAEGTDGREANPATIEAEAGGAHEDARTKRSDASDSAAPAGSAAGRSEARNRDSTGIISGRERARDRTFARDRTGRNAVRGFAAGSLGTEGQGQGLVVGHGDAAVFARRCAAASGVAPRRRSAATPSRRALAALPIDALGTTHHHRGRPLGSGPGGGRIEVRVSEPPGVRARLERAIRDTLAAHGAAADSFDIVVLSAYKQGYSWLHDEVLPRLRGRDVGRIEIGYHHLAQSEEVRWQTVASDTRWLQELFPIDAVLARELGIADSAVVFRPTVEREPVYTVRVLDGDGREILTDSFDPKYVVRPFFDLFPEYEKVRVTTGWVTIEADGRTLLDRRLRTDPERFWDFLQTDVYGRIVEYTMDVQDGRPSRANAPYFDEFRVELRMSEPNHRTGVDEEVISSLEALHEDIYFETLTLFDLIGQRYGVGGLRYPGRVLPHIDPTGAGGPGRARVVFTGKERGRKALELTHREADGEPVRRRYDLGELPVEAPKLRAIAVRAGDDEVARMLFDVVAVDSVDRAGDEAYRERASEEAIDRALLSAELMAGMVDELHGLHDAGLLERALSFDRVGELAFRFVLEDERADTSDIDDRFERVVVLPRSRRPRSTENPELLARGWEWGGGRLVQWRTPIPPAENDSVLARLATFPGVDVYYVARSFLGQPVWAMDLLPPHDAEYISQAKLNALKPTLFLSGRQHANEVSSTSHILRLAELLATDSSYAALLKRANVVLHPITNPDGARLAVEMQETNPDFMLHAGYLGALGVDATAGSRDPDPVYPESHVRPEIMATWLPDVYVNMHGYPSHEWVQYFAGYSAWVRGRTGTSRTWWAPRGWFIPGFRYVDDEENPEYGTAQFAALDAIAASITGDSAVQAMSERMYARYAKYGRQDRENFREHFHDGVLVYLSLRGRESIGTGVGSPRITYMSLTTEAPDETARGEWLELVASAGLAHSTALLRYLAEGENRIERETEAFSDFVVRRVFRKKPVLPEEDAAADGVAARGGGG